MRAKIYISQWLSQSVRRSVNSGVHRVNFEHVAWQHFAKASYERTRDTAKSLVYLYPLYFDIEHIVCMVIN